MSYIPFLAVAVVAYNVVVIPHAGATSSTIFVVQLLSGVQWAFSIGDSSLVLGLLFLICRDTQDYQDIGKFYYRSRPFPGGFRRLPD